MTKKKNSEKSCVGIDAIAFYTPSYALDLHSLATAQDTDASKYHRGLGQYQMSIAPPDEDIVTMAANASAKALKHVDPNSIDMVILATETGIDQSKAASIYVHQLLKLSPQCRALEVKQACYSGTAALHIAAAMVQQNPSSKILVVMADIARYGLNTPAEPSQGSGALAMIVSQNPRILALDPENSFHTQDVMDFWRPNYREEALVEGQYSAKVYLNVLEKVWKDYQKKSQRSFDDHSYYCYHAPVSRLAEKAHNQLYRSATGKTLSSKELHQQLSYALHYNRLVGNCYTASLYLSLISLLETAPKDLTDARIGFYSYGSGCVGEYFSGVVQPTYKKMLGEGHYGQLRARKRLSYETYREFYQTQLPEDGSEHIIQHQSKTQFRLSGIKAHKRLYQTNSTLVNTETAAIQDVLYAN